MSFQTVMCIDQAALGHCLGLRKAAVTAAHGHDNRVHHPPSFRALPLHSACACCAPTRLQVTWLPELQRLHIHDWQEPGLYIDDMAIQCVPWPCLARGPGPHNFTLAISSDHGLYAAIQAIESSPNLETGPCFDNYLINLDAQVIALTGRWPKPGLMMFHNVTLRGRGQ